MTPYQTRARFVIGERVSLHAFHWLSSLPTPPGPASISVCGMVRSKPDWQYLNRKGQPTKTNSWKALHRATCGLCKQVLAAYTKREWKETAPWMK